MPVPVGCSESARVLASAAESLPTELAGQPASEPEGGGKELRICTQAADTASRGSRRTAMVGVLGVVSRYALRHCQWHSGCQCHYCTSGGPGPGPGVPVPVAVSHNFQPASGSGTGSVNDSATGTVIAAAAFAESLAG